MEELYKELDKLVEKKVIFNYDLSDSFTDSYGNDWLDILVMYKQEEETGGNNAWHSIYGRRRKRN